MSPEKYAEALYWDFAQFENLETKEIKKCCNIVLDRLTNTCDGTMKWYYEECRKYIERRGV